MSQAIAATMRPDDRPLNAIILDDDEFDRQRICRMVNRLDLAVNVVAVPTIEDMLSALDETVFDLFLIDYRLKNATGFEALDHLAEDRFDGSTKIMLSGYQAAELAVEARQRGCADFIGKDSLTPELLRAQLMQVRATLVRASEVSPVVIDAALRAFASQHLPALMADALGSAEVATVFKPLISSIVQEAISNALEVQRTGSDLRRSDDLANLLGSMGDELNLGRLTDSR